MENTAVKLSVVVTTFNRCECLRLNLDEFRKQNDTEFELIVSMDGCTDGTRDVLEEYRTIVPFEMRWVNTGLTHKYGLAKARNMGILESSGNAVVILDDDSFPTPDFVKEHKRTVKRNTLTGGFRNSHPHKDDVHKALEMKMKDLMKRYYFSKFTGINLYELTSMIENNCCMFKDDWIDCGLFSEEIEGYGGIGQEFTRRLADQDYRYQFNPRAMIYHHGEFADDYGLVRSEKIRQAAINSKILQQ